MAVERPVFEVSDVFGETVEVLGKERSRYVPIGPFLAADFADQYANIYAFKPQPISLHQTLSYLERYGKRKFSHKPNPDQGVLFEEIIETKDYARKVEVLGKKSDLSNSPFLLRVIPLVEGKILEDELPAEEKGKKRKREKRDESKDSFQIVGKLDEVRTGGKTTIVRVIDRDGSPSENDAICLSLDWLVMQSMSKRNGINEFSPSLKVFNVQTGKLYEAILDLDKLIIEALKALELGDLTQRADYIPKPIRVIAEIKPESLTRANIDKSKIIIIGNDNLVKETLTAEEAFIRGENGIKRIAGELEKTERLYSFVEVQSPL